MPLDWRERARSALFRSLRVKLRRLEKRFLVGGWSVVGGWLRLCCLLAQVRENIKKDKKKEQKQHVKGEKLLLTEWLAYSLGVFFSFFCKREATG